MVALREGDVDVEFVACLVAQDAVLKAGDHAAAAQLHGLVLCGAALEGHGPAPVIHAHLSFWDCSKVASFCSTSAS